MNPIRVVLLGLVTTTGTGCFTARPSGPDWFYNAAARNLTEKPIANIDERVFAHVIRQHADAAYETVCRSPGKPHSDPYAHGFREGFIDFVEAGGTGEPPYLPPFRYRLTKYRSADGIRVVEDWYAGFRHGAAVARGSGLRELNYVPLPGAPVPADHGPRTTANVTVAPPTMPPAPAAPPAPMPQPNKPPEFLPAPRPVVPAPPPIVPVPPVVPAPGVGQIPATLPPRSAPVLVPTAATSPARSTISANSPVPALSAIVLVSASSAATHAPVTTTPKRAPMVVLDRTEPAAADPAPAESPSADFSPWKPAQKPRTPTVVRDP